MPKIHKSLGWWLMLCSAMHCGDFSIGGWSCYWVAPFPVFRHKLAALLGDAAVIVDSAQTTALQVAEALKSDNAGASGDVTFLATDGAERFRRVGAYFLGKAMVPLSW